MMRAIVLCVFCIGSASPAMAYRQTINQRLDQALSGRPDARLVLAGCITGLVETPPEASLHENAPPGRVEAIQFSVRSVILGSPTRADTVIEVPVLAFDWPTELLPCEQGRFCILVLHPAADSVLHPGNSGRYHTRPVSVVPAREQDYPPRRRGSGRLAGAGR